MRVSLMCCIVLLITACSGGGESENASIILDDKTDMVNKANDVEAMIEAASEQQRQRIDEQMK